jgi:AraC-like DNA-binding protein
MSASLRPVAALRSVAEVGASPGLLRGLADERLAVAIRRMHEEYLLTWRMALAKGLLRNGGRVTEVAEQVGYRSASSFSVAFSRHVGAAPVRYAREATVADTGGQLGHGALQLS